MKKYCKYKKEFDKDQQTIKSFNRLYRKESLQYNLNNENEYESLFIFFTKYLDETKNESFYKCQQKK